MKMRMHRRKNYSEITVQDGVVHFPGRNIALKEVASFQVDHRAFACTTAFLLFVLGSLACLYYMPGFIILVAGCIFIWLKVEFSRYVELKVQFKDGSSRRMLSASITDRVGLYRLYDRLAAALEKFNSNTGDSRENG